MSLKYYKTFYIGTDNTDEIVENDDVIVFDERNLWSYTEIVGVFNEAYWKTAFQYATGIRQGPRKVKMMVPIIHQPPGLKCNEKNANTALETLEWFLENLEPPCGGMIISIFFYDNKYPGYTQPWASQVLWPFSRQWKGDGDYVTLQFLTGNTAAEKFEFLRHHKEVMDKFEELCPYPVKYISYVDGEELTLQKLIHSKRHFVYGGGTYQFAGMVDIPTICYGDMFGLKKPFRWSPIYDPKRTNYPDKIDRRIITYTNSKWSTQLHVPGLPGSRICHYDIEKKIPIQKPQTYIIHPDSNDELLGYVTFTKPLNILNRDRKDWHDLTDLPIPDVWPVAQQMYM